MASTASKTMKALVLTKPFEVVVKDVPIPTIKDPKDVIVRVQYSGLCGSDLHPYRGHAGNAYGYINGHELVGRVVEAGSSVHKFKVGDGVVASFHTSCGSCFYCDAGLPARCKVSVRLGSPQLEGAQAEYVRIPLADNTLFSLPNQLAIPKQLLVLLADVIPTGLSVATLARQWLDTEGSGKRKGVCVVMGCGPVGLCAVITACTLFDKVYATDPAATRRQDAEKVGAAAYPFDELKEVLKRETDGRGADAVLEAVGVPAALLQACEIARPFGVIAACGVHSRPIELNGNLIYNRNLRFLFGRCSVPTYFSAALELLSKKSELFSSFIQHTASLDEAPEYYQRFERNEIGKTVFVLHNDD